MCYIQCDVDMFIMYSLSEYVMRDYDDIYVWCDAAWCVLFLYICGTR